MDFSQILYSPQASAVQPVPVPQGNVGQIQPADIAPQRAAAPQPAGFNDVVNNPAGAMMQAKPPSTPEELSARKSQWSQVLDAFQKDPNLRATLLYMGTQLMQPMQPGQTTGGHIGQSIQGGMQFLAGREELDRRRKLEAEKFKLETQRTQSDIRRNDAATASSEYALEEQRKTEGLRLKKLDLDLQKAEGEIANIADERSLRVVQKRIANMQEEIKTIEMSEFMAPEAAARRQKLQQLEVQAKESEIRWRNAQAKTAGTSPPDAIDKATADKVNDPMWRAKQGLPEGTPMETYRNLARTEAARENKTYSTSKSGTVQAAEKYEMLWRTQNPKDPRESDEQYEKKVAQAVLLHMDKYPQLYAQTNYELPPSMQNAGVPPAAPTGGQANDRAAWEAARKSVPVGSKYVGPDGKTYTRGE